MEEFMNENNGTNGPTVPTGPTGPDGPAEPLVPPQANNNNDMDDIAPLVPPPKEPPNKNADDYDDDIAPLVPDEPPIEIEVPDDEDLDLEVVKKEIKDLAERGFWSMKFENAEYVAPYSFTDLIDLKQTLNLTLDQEGPGGTGMYGDYYGKGTLALEEDTSRLKAEVSDSSTVLDVAEGTGEGPFTASVWLDPIDPAKAEEDIGEQVYQHLNLTGLDPSKDPDDEIGIENYNRNRIKQTVGGIVGYGGSYDATWVVSGSAFVHGYGPKFDHGEGKDGEHEYKYFVAPFVFSSGVVKLHLYPQGAGVDSGYFWGRISRVVDGKELV